MSKGHGAAQRAVIAVFTADPEAMLDSIEIAGRAFDKTTITESESSSFRRALGALVKEGQLVDLTRHWRGGRRRYALPAKAEEYYRRVERHSVPVLRQHGRPSDDWPLQD
jgi:hypothetical protein